MLTSIFYYNIYKPYIMGSRGVDSFAPKRARIADRKQSPEFNGQIYVLNKSVKNEIVQYAQNVSFGVTNLRSSTRQTANDMENFNRTVREEGRDDAVNNLVKGLSKFTDYYNKSAAFMQSQDHSSGLRSFSYEVADNVYYNRERLGKLGLGLSESGQLDFNRSFLQGMSHEEINIAIGETIKIFADLQGYADQLLTEPLVEHMHFKGLGYHYNYKMGRMEADGFNLLEAGLIIDMAV